jgi:hypothetical protein
MPMPTMQPKQPPVQPTPPKKPTPTQQLQYKQNCKNKQKLSNFIIDKLLQQAILLMNGNLQASVSADSGDPADFIPRPSYTQQIQ